MIGELTSNSPTRPAGQLERFSTARHHLGYYRHVATTARYSTNQGVQLLSSIIEAAVAEVVREHTALCCGILNEDKHDPDIIRFKNIDLKHCIKYYNVPGGINTFPVDDEKEILSFIELQHRALFKDLDQHPGWRLTIISTRKVDAKAIGVVFDAVFSFHHVLADGLSGMVFHRELLAALNNQGNILSPKGPFSPVTVIDRDPIDTPLENMLKFSVSWPYFLQQVWEAMKPVWLFPDQCPPWTGATISPTTAQKYESRVKLITIPANLVKGILAACRREQTTIIGLLHGLIVASLASKIPKAAAFSSNTPYSMRHATGISSTKWIGVNLGPLSLKYSLNVIQKKSAETTDQIWSIARSFKQAMTEELARVPLDNPLGMLRYVTNYHKLFTSDIGKKRNTTYEISNIGALNNEGESTDWEIQTVIFSQSGGVSGTAV